MPRDLHGQDPVLGYSHGNDPVRGYTQTEASPRWRAGVILCCQAIAAGAETDREALRDILQMIGFETQTG